MRAWIGVVAAASVLAAVGCGGGKSAPEVSEAKSRPEAPAAASPSANGESVVEIAPDKLKQIKVESVASAEVPANELSSPGKVEANPNRTSHVLLPVQGRLSKVLVHIGDAVKQGQTLLTVESPDVDAAISVYLQAQAAVTQSRAALAKAEADLDRTKDLFDNNAVAKKEVLNAENMRTQTSAALEQALASEKQALRRLEILGIRPGEFGQSVEVRAPVSGKILEMTVVPGEYRNDISQPVLTIADLSTVWVTSDVPEASIRYVQRGQRVQIELDAYPDEKFTGRVTQIADTVDPQTRTVKVRAEMENSAGKLRPEMFARIRLSDRYENRPVAPASAVVQGENGSWVMREVGAGKFKRTAVTTGNRQGNLIAILSGLHAGDRIVTDGVLLVRN